MAERGKAGGLGRGAAKGRKAQNATAQKDCPGDDPFAYNELTLPKKVPPELLPKFVELMKSADPQHQFHGALMVRKLLTVEQNAPIDEVVAFDAGPILVQFLSREDNPKLQFEAAWALSNIAAGLPQHAEYVLSNNAAPALVKLLSSPSEDCKEQAAWALGNLSGDNAECRDYILSLNVVEPLLRVLGQGCHAMAHRNAVWALSNLCRGKPPPELEKIAPAIPVFVSLLNNSDDEIVMDAAWALSYICDGGTERVKAVLAHSPAPGLVHLLVSPASAHQTPAIRTIGSIVTGTEAQTQSVIDAGALNSFPALFNSPKRGIRKEACWTLSNILAGTKEQIQAVIAAGLLPPLLNCLFAVEFEVKKEALWAIANLTAEGSEEQIGYLVGAGGLDSLRRLLGDVDMKIVGVALEAIDNVLRCGEATREASRLSDNPYSATLTTVVPRLEALQNSADAAVSTSAESVLDELRRPQRG